MKWIIVSALMTAMPHWISSALACSKHEGANVTTKVMVVGDATSQGEGEPHVVKLVGSGDGDGNTGADKPYVLQAVLTVFAIKTFDDDVRAAGRLAIL